jgi:YHS domain-containing protein
MRRSYITSAIAGALVLGLATAAVAATKGEFNNMCTEGLARGKDVATDCSVNATIKGKTYCFGSEQAKSDFMKDPRPARGGYFAATTLDRSHIGLSRLCTVA